jgi:hypothetical protein
MKMKSFTVTFKAKNLINAQKVLLFVPFLKIVGCVVIQRTLVLKFITRAIKYADKDLEINL